VPFHACFTLFISLQTLMIRLIENKDVETHCSWQKFAFSWRPFTAVSEQQQQLQIQP